MPDAPPFGELFANPGAGAEAPTVNREPETVNRAAPAPRPLTITEYTRQIKDTLTQALPPCWLRGEISNLRAQPSGHIYLTLKDAGAQLSAVLFRAAAARQTATLRDGQQITALGRINVYEPRGQYQFIIDTVTDDGEGRLQREFETLKRRLAAEGLFAPGRKRPIPPMPPTIGIITSPTGAALQDFIRILHRRHWRGRLIILPAKVQGADAAPEIAAQLAAAQTLPPAHRPTLLVLARGGGSLEDLWAFNEEPLIRAIAASDIPIISAIGHEIDYTLSDFAADHRAETPSAAAEFITSHYLAHADRATRAAAALAQTATDRLARAREHLAHLGNHLRLLSPAAQVEQNHLRLDATANRLASALQRALHDKRHRLTLARAAHAARTPATRVQHASQHLLALYKRLQAASPASILNRGFVIMRDEQGRPLPRRSAVPMNEPLTAQFADAPLRVRAE